MEFWWNDAKREASKYSEKSMSQCHFDQDKFHIDWPRIEHAERRLKYEMCPVHKNYQIQRKSYAFKQLTSLINNYDKINRLR